jgi:type I restriction enzyme S subunit
MTSIQQKQLRHAFTVICGATPDSGKAEYWDGDILWVTPEDVSSTLGYWLDNTARKITQSGYESCAATLAAAGSIVLTKRAPIGQLAILAKEACSNQGCFLLSTRDNVNERYYYYWLNTQVGWLQILGRGSTFMELSTDEIKSLKIPSPQFAFQKKVADFLDREMDQIDALVEAKNHWLNLLVEKRRSLITHAVTHGLNSNAPMRNSGIPWLGDIPTHWTLCHLKRVLSAIDYGISDSVDTTGNVAVLRMGDIKDGDIDYSNVGFVDDAPQSLLLQPDDLLFNRTNSLDQVGKVALFRGNIEYNVTFASYLVRFRCGKTILPEYLNWLLNSAFPQAWGRAEALPSIGQANLNPNRYGYLPIAVPPLSEQEEIIKYINKVTAQIGTLRNAVEHSIVLIKEHRAALIAAAVMGQLSIPEA